jgi:hypothetical protein
VAGDRITWGAAAGHHAPASLCLQLLSPVTGLGYRRHQTDMMHFCSLGAHLQMQGGKKEKEKAKEKAKKRA